MGYFIRALIERKVFQSLALYIAVMWLILQVIDVAQEPLSLPLWVPRALIFATLIGTPIVSLVSWFYDFKYTHFIKAFPEANRKVNAQAVFSFALIVVAVVSISVVISRQWDEKSIPISDAVVTIAVLPFALDGSASQLHLQFLANDVAESLERLSDVRLIPEDVMDTVDLGQRKRALAEQLGSNYLISGAIDATGDEVTLDVNITDERENIVWQQTFLGADLAVVNQLVANAVINQLGLQSAVAPEFTSNARAYDLYLRGQQEFAIDGISDEGVTYMQDALSEDARFALPLTALCNYNLRMYKFEKDPLYFEEAERSCFRALTLLAVAPEVHLALGWLYQFSGQPERSIEEFRRVLSLNPEHYAAQLGLARSLGDEQSGYEEAERLLITLTQRHPGSAGAFGTLQNLYYRTGRYEEALGSAFTAIRLSPRDEGYKYSYSGLLLLTGNFEEAKEFLLDVLETNPDNRSGFEDNLATAYFFDGDFAAAADLYRNYSDAVPSDDRALANLGDALWHAEGPEVAAGVFERVLELARSNLEINPNDADHLQSIIIAAGSLGERELLNEAFNNAIAAAPQNPITYYRGAVAYMRVGNSELAEEYANRSIAMGFPRILVENDADLKPLFT